MCQSVPKAPFAPRPMDATRSNQVSVHSVLGTYNYEIQ